MKGIRSERRVLMKLKIRNFNIELNIDTAIILLLLFASGTCYTSIHQPKVYMATLLILILLLVFRARAIVSGKSVVLLLAMFFLNLVTASLNADLDAVNYMGFFITFVIGFCACNLMEKERFYEIFLNIILFFCVFSLILTVVSNMYPAFILKFPVSEYRNFHNVYGLHTFLGIYPSQIDRNCGPFREPGVFEIYLNFALMIVMFRHDSDKRKLTKILLFVITIASTKSSTGIIAMAAIFAGYIFYRPQTRNKTHKYLKMIMMVGFVISVAAVLTIPGLLLLKLNPSSAAYSSYLTRHTGTLMDLKLWLDAPIFGQGITNYESIYAGTANSVTKALAIYGLIFTFLEAVLLWRFIKGIITRREGIATRLCVAAAMAAIFYTQDILFFPFIQTMLFFEAFEIKKVIGRSVDEDGSRVCARTNAYIENKL